MYQPSPSNLYLQALVTICITSPGPEFTFTLPLVVAAVVVILAVVVISLE